METPYFYNDITSLLKTDAKIDYIMIPKACTGIKHIYRLLGIPLIPLIETAEGFTKINDIAHEDGVSMISWAAADFHCQFLEILMAMHRTHILQLPLQSLPDQQAYYQ